MYTNPSRATIPLIRPHQCDSEGGRIRGVLLYNEYRAVAVSEADDLPYRTQPTDPTTRVEPPSSDPLRIWCHFVLGQMLSPYCVLVDKLIDAAQRGYCLWDRCSVELTLLAQWFWRSKPGSKQGDTSLKCYCPTIVFWTEGNQESGIRKTLLGPIRREDVQ